MPSLLPFLDRLNEFAVSEFVDAERAQLAAEAGALDAPERELWPSSAQGVHPDHAGVDLVGDPKPLLLICTEHIGTQTEGCVVGDLDRLLLAGDAVDVREGAEELLTGGVVRR